MKLPETVGLCDTAWLAARLDDPQVRIVDGSFFLPGSGRDPRSEFIARHIPGATFFDIDAVCDPSSELPHMLPTPEEFGAKVQSLGIQNRNIVVAYDAPGSISAARVWWTFRVFGHDHVVVLDGGLAKWTAEGRPVVEGEPPALLPSPPVQRRRPTGRFRGLMSGRTPRRYIPGFRPALVRNADDLMRTIGDGDAQVVDARGSSRFAGDEPEPRPSRRQGHIPRSINLPFAAFFDTDQHGIWRPEAELAEVFAGGGVDLDQPIISYCGSGVSACVVALAAFRLGHDAAAVYDGSWAEWGNRDDTPIDR